MTTLKRLLLATTILTVSGMGAAHAANDSGSRIIIAQQAAPEPDKKPEGKPPAPPAGQPPAARPAQQQPGQAPQQPAAPSRPTPPAAQPGAPAQPPAARQPQRPETPPAAQPRMPDQPPAARPQRPDAAPNAQPNVQKPPASETPVERTRPAPTQSEPRSETPPQQRRDGPPPAQERRAPGQTDPSAAPQQATPPAAAPQTPPAPPAAQPAPQTQTAPSVAPRGPGQARRIDDLRQERREERRGNSTFIREGDRTIIQQGDRTIIRRDEADRFRGRPDVRTERRGNENFTILPRPGGVQIITVTDADGRLVRRVRRDPRGQEVVIIDNRPRGPQRADNFYVQLPPPVIRIPRDRYILEADRADPRMIYETLIAPPVDRLERRYSLDEIRYSAPLRDRMSRIDVDTITFDTGSWDVTANQADRLAPIADAMRRAIQRNPNEVFMVEGHTNAVGADIDNLSLSDRRAESVANLLSDQFGIPPENLITQGYGEQYLKIPTEAAERQNRRVSVRRITPLLAGEPGGPR